MYYAHETYPGIIINKKLPAIILYTFQVPGSKVLGKKNITAKIFKTIKAYTFIITYINQACNPLKDLVHKARNGEFLCKTNRVEFRLRLSRS